jgi:hypothetical protein
VFPEEQRKDPIVCLGLSAQVRGNRKVVCLDGHGVERDLDLHGWLGCWRFLGVRRFPTLDAGHYALGLSDPLSPPGVVVYKVGRLIGSLADFAKMVELFEALVSVTQQFKCESNRCVSP